MCDELVNESLFLGLDHTRTAYAANLSATRDRLRNPDQLRRSHVAPPAPHGVKSAGALIALPWIKVQWQVSGDLVDRA